MAKAQRGQRVRNRAQKDNDLIDAMFSSPEEGKFARQAVAGQLKNVYGGAQKDLNRQIKSERRELEADSQFATDTYGGVQQSSNAAAEKLASLEGGQSQAYRELAATMGTALGMKGAETADSIRRTGRGNVAKLREDRRDLKGKRRGDRYTLLDKARSTALENDALAKQYNLKDRALDLTDQGQKLNYALGGRRITAGTQMNNADNQTSASNNAASNQQSDTNSQRTAEQRAADRKARRQAQREDNRNGPKGKTEDATAKKVRSEISRYFSIIQDYNQTKPTIQGDREAMLKFLRTDARGTGISFDQSYMNAAMDLLYDGRVSPANARILRQMGVNVKRLNRGLGRRPTVTVGHPNP